MNSTQYRVLDTSVYFMYNSACVKKSPLQSFLSRGGNIVAKDLDITLLLDFYGDMLTDKQKSFVEYYYDDDLSLAEIAENDGLTRQGVRDAIKRAEAQLFEMEETLGFVKRFSDMNDGLGRISGCVDKINDYNMHYGLSREINDNVAEIRAILAQLNS